MIKLVYEHKWKPNIWFPNLTGHLENDIHYCHFYKRQIPWMLQFFLPDIRLITPSQIDSVDSFIYPVLMQEPYLQIRTLINNSHEDFGFWSYVDERVVESLRQGKGRIIIDATMEPPNRYDMEQLIEALKDCSQYPNDKIHINISDQRFVDHERIHCFPSFLELHFCARHMYDPHNTFTLEVKGKNKQMRFNIPIDYESPHNPDIDYNFDYPKKRYALLNKRTDKHLGAVFINTLLSQNNLLKDGLVSVDFQGQTLPELYESLKDTTNDSRFADISINVLKDGKTHTTDDFLVISKVMEAIDFNLVVEAYFSNNVIDWPLITEKVWRNVASKKPFVVIGQQNTLKWFKQLGYESFHPFINETYDQVENDYNRIMRAFIEAKRLIELSQEKMDLLLNDCEPIFLHNQKNFENRVVNLREFIDDKI
jgi:hypothetical protein